METAQHLAHTLVEQRLIACVNILPQLQSVYLWEGKVVHEEEVLLLMKTQQKNYTAIEMAFVDVHPYEVPELIAVPVTTGLPAYLQWITEVTHLN